MKVSKRKLVATAVALTLMLTPMSGTNYAIACFPEDPLADFNKQDDKGTKVNPKVKKMKGRFA